MTKYAPEIGGGANSVLHIVRVKNRVYNDGRLVSHAEYAVVDGERVVARLILNRRSWVALEAIDGNAFGMPVSPINFTRFRDVKAWALDKRWEQ